jgi:FG-GAP-like repeat
MHRFACHGLRTVLPLLAVVLYGASAHADDETYALRAATGAPQGMGEAVRADNPAHGLTAWIRPEAVRVGPAGPPAAGTEAQAAKAWAVSLSLRRTGRTGRLAEVGGAGVETDGARAELHRGGLVEWYANGPQGLEQGFDLAERPDGDGGRAVVELTLALDGLRAVPAENGKAVAFAQPGVPLPVLYYRDLVVHDDDGRLLPASMELVTSDDGGPAVLRLTFEDEGARYPVRLDPLMTSSSWSSAASDDTTEVAWGDVDGDGDLDLAASGSGGAVVFENSGSTLGTTPVWSSTDGNDAQALAWGDWDGDGDLDLAVANTPLPMVYENLGGTLTTTFAWQDELGTPTTDVAWGDWNGDGDLDLIAGITGQYNRVYNNSGGHLSVPAWFLYPTSGNNTSSVAWGDVDGDGDLDVALGNRNQINKVVLNNGIEWTLGWSSSESDDTRSVAWGDWDGDGDFDLAVGNTGGFNRVYENVGGTLSTTAVWSSAESDDTMSVAWGDWDGDGDLDLAVGNFGGPNRVYENVGGGRWLGHRPHMGPGRGTCPGRELGRHGR